MVHENIEQGCFRVNVKRDILSGVRILRLILVLGRGSIPARDIVRSHELKGSPVGVSLKKFFDYACEHRGEFQVVGETKDIVRGFSLNGENRFTALHEAGAEGGMV